MPGPASPRPTVVIAQMDTGYFDATPPWMIGALWTNPAPTKVTAADIDDYIETEHGISFPRTTADPVHGSIVAGILAGNNPPFSAARASAYGAAQVLLMDGALVEGRATYRFERAVDFVVARKKAGANIRVFNASFGCESVPSALKPRWNAALSKLAAEDILVVAAAAALPQQPIGFPAAAGAPNLITVGRPGGGAADVVVDDDVHVTLLDGSTTVIEGTSFSAPQVSAMAAQMLFATPTLTVAVLKRQLIAALRVQHP